MLASFGDFITAIPSAATSPYAFAAYALAILSSAVVALKTKRNRELLAHLTELPERQRLKALELEMGSVRVPAGLTPEQWLRARIHSYLFAGFAAVCAVVLVVSVVAFTTKTANEGKVDVDMGLYEPPLGSATQIPAAAPGHS